MTKSAQQIAILSILGFRDVEPHPFAYFEGKLRHKVEGVWRWLDKDPLIDLDIMREAESAALTTIELQMRYSDNLARGAITAYDSLWMCASAPAEKRAEQLLRTLDLWVD